MAENLKNKEFNDGTSISLINDNSLWASATSPAYSEYNIQDNNQIYGHLYNWYAVNTGKLCPVGWHIPSDNEWLYLAQFLGGQSNAGGKLKETGTGHWVSPNTGATNESGFTGLPGGYRLTSVSMIGSYGCWWGSTGYDNENAIVWSLNYNNTWLNNNPNQKKSGASIRCVRD